MSAEFILENRAQLIADVRTEFLRGMHGESTATTYVLAPFALSATMRSVTAPFHSL